MKTIKGIWRFSRVICYTFVCLFQAYTRFKRVDRKEKGRMLRYYPTQVLKLAVAMRATCLNCCMNAG